MTNLLNIYVDTNVLVNFCTNQENDTLALKYIFSKRNKNRLFTSSLSIVQTIANLQSKKKTRGAYTREKTIELLNSIIPKFTILDLSYNDIKEGFNAKNNDIEDSVHYVLSQKAKCNAIITNNVKDFVWFNDIETIMPSLGILKQ